MAGKRKINRLQKKSELVVPEAESNSANVPSERADEERPMTTDELDAQIELLKGRKMELVRQTLENTPGTSRAMTEFSTSSINQSNMVPVDEMVTLLKQIRSDNKPLPKFSGDVLEWPAFFEEYERTTTDYQISDSTNRERLRKALTGEARLMVQDKIKSTCFLKDAIEELQRKYGGKANILKAAIARVDRVRRLGDNLRRIKTFVLDALSIQWIAKHCRIDGLDTTLLIKMLDLTPSIIRLKWGDYQREINKNECGNFDDFVNMLKRIERESNIEEIDQERDRGYIDKQYKRDAERYHPYERPSNRRAQRERSRTPPRVMNSAKEEDRFTRHNDNFERRADHYRPQGLTRKQNTGRQDTDFVDNNTKMRIMNIKDGNKNKVQSPRCFLGCEDNHSTLMCPKFTKASHMERCDLLRKYKLCLYCGDQHYVRDCTERQEKNM